MPQGFTLSLHQTADATLSWEAPSGRADSYVLVPIPLDGSPGSNVTLAGSATSTIQPVTAAGTCFALIAVSGSAYGNSDLVCGVPGVSTLGAASGRAASLAVAAEATRERLAGLRMPHSLLEWDLALP